VHLEHGHLYDPDNAPTHPLSLWSNATEPLGVALTRRFVARCDASAFAHAHETTLVRGLLRAFRLYGKRAPSIIAGYYATAAELLAEAGRQPGLAQERNRGERALRDFAEETGLSEEVIAALACAGPRPTHHRRQDTFFRLYLDRSIAAAAGVFAAAAFALSGRFVGLGLLASSVGYLSLSVGLGGSRYRGTLEQRLRTAAQDVIRLSDAALVVFGHSHQPDQAPGYLNLGAFGSDGSTGRSYALIDAGGTAERRVWPPAGS
jgi:hypothetical protein